MNYPSLIGGMITCQFPYLFIIFCGWYFSKIKALDKDIIKSLSKHVIILLLPFYYFMKISGANSIPNLYSYNIIIISDVIKTVLSYVLSYTYASFSKMDYRYKNTWIAMISIQDVRLMNEMLSNTFCYILSVQNNDEKIFCKNSTNYSYVHLFFHQIVIWYLIFNIIRRDKLHTSSIKILSENINKIQDNIIIHEANSDYALKETSELALKFKNNKINDDEIYVSKSFALKAETFNEKYLNQENKSSIVSVLYTILQPVLISIFSGFILGFITPLNLWFYNKTSVMSMFVDTFNTIGNANIACSYLMMGIILYYSEKQTFEARFKMSEYIVLLIFKCILLPFFGLIFIQIARLYINNSPLLFLAYIQWFLPTSQDILIICISKNVSTYSVTVGILLQYTYMIVFNNFIMIAPLLKIFNYL